MYVYVDIRRSRAWGAAHAVLHSAFVPIFRAVYSSRVSSFFYFYLYICLRLVGALSRMLLQRFISSLKMYKLILEAYLVFSCFFLWSWVTYRRKLAVFMTGHGFDCYGDMTGHFLPFHQQTQIQCTYLQVHLASQGMTCAIQATCNWLIVLAIYGLLAFLYWPIGSSYLRVHLRHRLIYRLHTTCTKHWSMIKSNKNISRHK